MSQTLGNNNNNYDGESQAMRRTAENDLDAKTRAILNERGLNPYEKIKKYNALLQRYLTLVKQGEEERRLYLKTARGLPRNSDEPEEKKTDENEEKDEKEAGLDETARGVLQNLPQRDRKNAEYIMKKLVKSEDGWTPKGEFIHEGKIVRGSHMIDLFKNLSVSYKKKSPTPKGWTGFLNTLTELNIPISSVTNPRARAQYRRLKTVGGWREGEETEEEEEEEEEGEEGAVALVKREKGKRKKQDLIPFAEEEEEWVTPVKRSERKKWKTAARWINYTA
ncbi:hypothetical protein ABVT39_007702 [Epinephelus coioides]